MKTILSILGVLFLTMPVQGQNPMENFSLTDVTSGKTIALHDYKSSKAVAVIFTSNSCPYDIYYEERLLDLINEFGPAGVQFLLINSHTEGDESVEQMKEKAGLSKLRIPYLADKEQVVMEQFGARRSPEVFLLQNQGGKFSLFYRGAIDNNPQVAADVRDQYLKDNIMMLLSGKTPALRHIRPTGCVIR